MDTLLLSVTSLAGAQAQGRVRRRVLDNLDAVQDLDGSRPVGRSEECSTWFQLFVQTRTANSVTFSAVSVENSEKITVSGEDSVDAAPASTRVICGLAQSPLHCR